MNNIIIASYPRSGSTYLRFLICNLDFPDREHDFDSVNKLIPTLESVEEMALSNSFGYYKTHEKINYASHCLYRHVKDVLRSEYKYHVNFQGETKSFDQWIEEMDYGNNWREFVNFYFGIQAWFYDDLISDTFNFLKYFVLKKQTIYSDDIKRIELAIQKSSKEKVSSLNQKFIDPDLPELTREIENKILEKNWRELKMLGYD